jgi:hypothetical protein
MICPQSQGRDDSDRTEIYNCLPRIRIGNDRAVSVTQRLRGAHRPEDFGAFRLLVSRPALPRKGDRE